ncbi:MAG: alkaline phosphatase family protein [Gemmatimonadaceae bacterium]|nr:alkaline phosphatase family protein [Gemmatimonadaceae bacterium]
MTLVILVADGARPDTLRSALDTGALPALARLREEGGGLHEVTSVFPSVTGPAYTPFLLGRFPGAAGIPGIRWWDRARTATRWPDYARSYVGAEARHADRDLAPDAPTLFESVPRALAALSPLGRGLALRDRIGFGIAFGIRAGWTHFRGDVRGWLVLDRELGRRVCERVRRDPPDVAFLAHPGIDKVSHQRGHGAPEVFDAMRIVDETAAQLRADAQRDGRPLRLWVVSDHGHSPVRHHEDLAGLLAAWGLGVIAHPWVFGRGRDAAVMVSGNAMSHVYLDLRRRTRPWWPALAPRFEAIASRLLERPSTDLLILPHAVDAVEVRHRTRGAAMVTRCGERYGYSPVAGGDPLALHGTIDVEGRDAAHDACAASDYPDALVQLTHLCGSARCGDLLVSAARDWDLRAKYEPIPHVSSHGALHAEHMRVPLLLDAPPVRAPRRTTDVFPSALHVLGRPAPSVLDGASFY